MFLTSETSSATSTAQPFGICCISLRQMGLEDEEDEQQQHEPMRITKLHSSEAFDDSQSVPTLLPEIVIDILLRLPVESLLRCRSVCKSWRSMISDPYFVKSHLSSSTSNNHYAHHRLIFSTRPTMNLKSCPLYDVLYDKSVNALELDYPLKHPNNSIWIAGSCNGLLCIANYQDDTLFIWNPSTRRSNRLPYCFFKRFERAQYIRYGFGYDESTDDYKVVLISSHGIIGASKVKIYSLKSGYWKKIGDFPYGLPSAKYGTFCNGALHWASILSRTIVSLDLANETYGEVLQPVYDEGDKDLSLGVLGEWLCVLCYHHGNRADVWVMKVYGVKDSWTKLVSVPYLADPLRAPDVAPLFIANDGNVLLRFYSKLVLYDAKNGSSSEIQNFDECFEAYTLVESMVSPDAPSRP